MSEERKLGAGLRVLIAEDEFLVALSLEEDLRGHGCEIVGPFSKLADARKAAEAEDIDVGLLDVNMNGEMAYPVADALYARRIAFIFLSGYGAMNFPEQYRDAPRVPKPYDPSILIKEIRKILDRD
jgi:two-component system, response regulator PdtaR